MASIDNKITNYELQKRGEFGNRVLTWNSLEEFSSSGHTGPVTIRNKAKNSPFCKSHVSPDVLHELVDSYIREGALSRDIYFNESMPDTKLAIQGEVVQSQESLWLRYSTAKANMRDALANHSQHASGETANLLLRGHLDAASYDVLMHLFRKYPGHVVEFSTYSCDIGDIPGRNTIFWEVRNY